MKQTKSKRANPRSQRGLWLPVLTVLGGLLVLGAVLGLSLRGESSPPPGYEPEVSGGPSLKVDQEQIDLGDVKLGEWVSAAFTLTNVGDEPLEFTKKPYIQVVEGC